MPTSRNRIIKTNYPVDLNGQVVTKFLDLFETTIIDQTTDISVAPHYYGYEHPNGYFLIVKDSVDGSGVEHLLYYFGKDGETLATTFPNRAGLTYVTLGALF